MKSNAKKVDKRQAAHTEHEVKPVEVPVAEVPAAAPPVLGTPAELITKYGTKSAAIRALKASNMTTSAIAKALDIRYQHVRNVLNQPLKREIKVERANGDRRRSGSEGGEGTASTAGQ